MPTTGIPAVQANDLVVKVRIANSSDFDFIEVTLPRKKFTYDTLKGVCCKELGIQQLEVERIRKLPNTLIRKDSDVERLTEFQQLEIVLRNDILMNKGENCKVETFEGETSTCSINPSINHQVDIRNMLTTKLLSGWGPLVLQVKRVDRHVSDPDWIRVELPYSKLNYMSLLNACCKGLGIYSEDVVKIRKVPHFRILNDSDVKCLSQFDCIEVLVDFKL
ncbi:uncharacterized protein LOC108740048 [Agrilus planipennis]|uniref:Uncharacterized protein LOC108740048 n=1 Tax=Agrilus planipennis TaxID=224129 RepID=A0A1W4X0R5_AGRPL|nr:uncharacterized protein LOC108740048 [Agrilus planipennis]